jgi:hypothetical protein
MRNSVEATGMIGLLRPPRFGALFSFDAKRGKENPSLRNPSHVKEIQALSFRESSLFKELRRPSRLLLFRPSPAK